jgi:quinol monooxygenase YgiN
MLYINVQLHVKDSADINKVGELLQAHGRLSRAEPGCVRFDVYHSKSDPAVYLLCEHWDTEASLDQHRLAEGYLTIYKPQVIPLVDRTPHMCDLLE